MKVRTADLGHLDLKSLLGELAAQLPEEALWRLGCRISPSSGQCQAPEEPTLRRTLRALGGKVLRCAGLDEG